MWDARQAYTSSLRAGGGRLWADEHREDVGFNSDHVISTMPLRELICALDPAPPDDVLGAAHRLRYRDFLTVVLIVKRASVFPDNWIYVHAP